MKKLLQQLFWPLILISITVFISATNYVPGKWLTGWDTLQPELNFPLHISRSIFGAWRQDQGLGAVAAHSHMSELPRILILWIMSLALPLNIVRVGFIYLCFILGPLGIYYFAKEIISKGKNILITNLAAFLGAVVYIFNLGTAQHFYVVFEMFAVQYAILGWLFLFAIKILNNKDSRNYLYFFLLSFFSAPMAYASQLWFAYFGALIFFLFTITFQEKRKIFIKKSLIVLVLTILANSFWLFPNLYFLLSDASKIPANSQINKLFSPESFLHNANFGKIKDVAIFKNFLFNWLELKADGKFGDLLPQWTSHLSQIGILVIGYAVFIVSLVSMVSSVIKKKKILIALLPVWFLALFMLMNMNPPFNFFFEWLRENISIFKEGLRTPFTKFSLLLMFSTSVYFAFFFAQVMTWIVKFDKKRGHIINLFITILASTVLAIYGLPLLQGQLINKKLFNDIPTPYFSLYSWFDTQPEQARVVNLPLQTSAGWEYFDWGYEGAGFVWFGMKQPLAVRDFDRWNPHNESLYKELSTALYGNDSQAFQRTLLKYDISFLLLDESINNPNKPEDDIKKTEIKALLKELNFEQVWHEDFLSVYDVRKYAENKPFVYSPATYTLIDGDTTYNTKDPIYEENGPYIVSESNSSIIYPFASYLNDELTKFEYDENEIINSQLITGAESEYSVYIPSLIEGGQYTTQAQIYFTDNTIKIIFPNFVEVKINNQEIVLPQLPDFEIRVPSEFSTAVVAIGDKQTEVENNEKVNVEVTFDTSEPIKVDVFNLNDIKEVSGKKFISKNQITSMIVSESVWKELANPIIKTVFSPNEIRVTTATIPYNQNISSLETATICDSSRKNGWFKKLVSKDGALYQSGDLGVACDGVSLTSLNQNGSYILRWQGENIGGRGIKFYLQNLSTGRSDLEQLIPDKKTDISYVIGSWKLVQNKGYYLSWENRSFGSDVSENLIKSIDVYPYPLDTISKIKLIPKDSITVDSQAEIKNLWKFGTHHYNLTTNVNSESSLLVLSQSYENGWIAFEFKGIVPKLFKKVKYNGWANGWLLPKGEHKVTILFWPQITSFVGYALLVGGLIVTMWKWFSFRTKVAHNENTSPEN